MAPAIEVRGVSKRFRLYHEHYVAEGAHAPLRVGSRTRSSGRSAKRLDLEIAEGSTVGLLGHNGSGKSTLLKCVAGILQPTRGRPSTRGRVAALLELGAGFHPELTGRENIFMNGSILGLSKKHIGSVFDEIVAFAELETVHRHAGAALLVGHVRAARLRGRGERRARHPARRRGARGRRRGLPAQVPRADRDVPARGPHDRVRHPRGRPRPPDLRSRDRARPRRDRRRQRRPARRSGCSATRCSIRVSRR